MIFQIALAGKIIQIQSLHEQVFYMCKPYYVEPMLEEADIRVTIAPEDIEYERSVAADLYVARRSSDAYLETLAVYRKIATAMLEYDSWLMHGAVFAFEGQAYMMTATSGTGKTTLIRMALKNFQDSYVINGDKPLLHIADQQVIACGTPWSGKERMNRNCQVPLKSIFILERGESNELEELRFVEAFPTLLQQTYKPVNGAGMKKTLELLKNLGNSGVRFYRLTLKRYSSVKELENEEVVQLLRKII